MKFPRFLALLALLGCQISLASASDYFVVLGSFSSAERAWRYTEQLGSGNVLESEGIYRVVVGPHDNRAAAESARETWRGKIDASWILAVEMQAPVSPSANSRTMVETESETKEPNQQATLNKRGIPADLNRGSVPKVSREQLQRFKEKQAQAAGTLLPEAPAAKGENISQLESIYIRDIQARGSNLLHQELNDLFAAFENRTVSMEELLELKNTANQMFVANGYVNSGILLPDQKVDDGLIYFQVIEGEIDDINIEGDFRDRFVKSRLQTSSPFNIQDLQQSLKLLEKNPLVQRVNARISPGGETGEANLNIAVEGRKRFRVGVTAANNRSPSIGSEYGELYFAADNLTRLGDSLRVGTAVTEGLDSYSFDYVLPLTGNDFRLVLSYANNDSSVIEEPFDDIDIESVTVSTKLGVILPIIKSTDRKLAIELFAEKRRNKTSIFGVPFSFTPGAINGESRVAPVRLGLSYVSQGVTQSFAARLIASKGTNSFDATDNPGAPDGDFSSQLLQLQYSRQLTDNFHMTARALAQHAGDPLLAIERVAMGGMSTVRGYRENQIVRDNAYLATLEGIYQLPFESLSTQLVVFTDYGSGKNHDDAEDSERDSLASIGLGFRVRSLRGFSGELYFAHGFDDVNVNGSDLQDDGVHFRLNYEARF